MTLINETHPALTDLPWEHADEDRYGVHGIACHEIGGKLTVGPTGHMYRCYCGYETKGYVNQEDAFAALVRHAERANEVARRPGARMVIKDEPTITWLIVSTEDGLRVVGDHDWAVRTLDEVESMIGKLTPIPSA